MVVGDGTRIVTFQHHRDTFLDGLKGLVTAAGSKGVTTVAVILVPNLHSRLQQPGSHPTFCRTGKHGAW